MSDLQKWQRVGRFADFVEGEPFYYDLKQASVVIFRVEDQLYAVEDRCSHDDGPLGDGVLDGCVIACPRHGARFDLRTGKALSAPAFLPISSYALKVEEEIVWIASKPTQN